MFLNLKILSVSFFLLFFLNVPVSGKFLKKTFQLLNWRLKQRSWATNGMARKSARQFFCLKRFLKKESQIKEIQKATDSLREIAKLSFLLSRHENGLKVLLKAQKLDLKTQNLSGQTINHILLSKFFDYAGEKRKTNYHLEKALKLIPKVTKAEDKAFVYQNAGIIELNNISLDKSFLNLS